MAEFDEYGEVIEVADENGVWYTAAYVGMNGEYEETCGLPLIDAEEEWNRLIGEHPDGEVFLRKYQVDRFEVENIRAYPEEDA